MDKQVIFSVAGSGKTSFIVKQLCLEKRALIITYTVNNFKNLRERIINRFGYFPSNIEVVSYFTFLYGFCFRPFLSHKIKSKGIFWEYPPQGTSRLARTDIKYYLSGDKRLYHNRLAKLLEVCNTLDDVKARITKYYHSLYIDEVQDFAGHDFNFLKSVSCANVNMVFVGDFFQHTFDTSRDGQVNKNLHNDYLKYQNEFKKMGMEVVTHLLNRSFRCSPTVCDFISEKIGIEIFSHKEEGTKVQVIENLEEANELIYDKEVVKLFYNKHFLYNCYSRNWGECKGEDYFQDVCVVLNKKSYKLFCDEKLNELPPTTKNKLYVACSRANSNLYLVSDELVKASKKRNQELVPSF